MTEKYQKLIDDAIAEGKKEDPAGGDPSDPRPVSGKGYKPPKGSPKLPANPYEKDK